MTVEEAKLDFDWWYDWGYRRGIFWKANGFEPLDTTNWEFWAREGYEDGSNSTERRI